MSAERWSARVSNRNRGVTVASTWQPNKNIGLSISARPAHEWKTDLEDPMQQVHDKLRPVMCLYDDVNGTLWWSAVLTKWKLVRESQVRDHYPIILSSPQWISSRNRSHLHHSLYCIKQPDRIFKSVNLMVSSRRRCG